MQHEYIPTNSYICTLTSGCIINEEEKEDFKDTQLHVGFTPTALSISKEFYIDKESLCYILSVKLTDTISSWISFIRRKTQKFKTLGKNQ